MSVGVEPGPLDRVGRGVDAPSVDAVVSPAPRSRRSRMPVRSTIQRRCVSRRASRSALVTRPSGTAVPQPTIASADRPTRTITHATRIHATGWPSRSRSPGCASMPISVPPNGLRTGHAGARSFDHARSRRRRRARHRRRRREAGRRRRRARRSCARAPRASRRRGRVRPGRFVMVDPSMDGRWSRRPGGWSRCEYLREVDEIVRGRARENGNVGNGALGDTGDHRAVSRPRRTRRRRARRASPSTCASARAR